MSFGAVDLTKPHCLITVHHPCTLMPLRRAPLAKGVYPIQGDIRGCFRHVRERRMIAAGVFEVAFFPGEEKVSAQTLFSPILTLYTDSSIVNPPAMDLRSEIPDGPAPEIPLVEEHATHVTMLPPVTLVSQPPDDAPVQLMDRQSQVGLSYDADIGTDSEIFVLEDEPTPPKRRRRARAPSA